MVSKCGNSLVDSYVLWLNEDAYDTYLPTSFLGLAQLVVEDVSTANFMARDGRMRASKEKII